MSKLRSKWRDLKTRMNLGLGKVAKLTHFIPEKPRKFVAEKLIRLTDPNRMARSCWPPRHDGETGAADGINLVGMFRAETGLSQGAKCYAEALELSGVPHRLLNADFMIWASQEDHRYDDRLVKAGEYGINVIHVNPMDLDMATASFSRKQFDNRYNIGVWLWELETLPREWLKMIPTLDEIWTPSEFIAEAVRKETDKPVTVIPYGISAPRSDLGRKDFDLPEDAFLVLAMYDSKSYAARKNPWGAIEAFRKAFGNDPETKAELVLKLGNGSKEEVQKLEEALKAGGIRYRLLRERYSREDLNALIACCDVFLSLHRSEGYGLVMAEAMYLGTPAIATGWSANTEFMPEGCTCLVDYTFVPVGNDYVYRDDSFRWADPDTNQAAGMLRKLYECPEERERMSREAAEYIRGEHSPAVCGERIRQRFEEIRDIIGAERTPRNTP